MGMAWNHPKEVRSAERPEHRASCAVRRVRCIVLGALCLAAVAVICWFLLASNTVSQTGSESAGRSRRIKEADPALSSATSVRSDVRAAAWPVFHAPTNKVVLTKNVTAPTNVLGGALWNIMSNGKLLFPRPLFTNSAENIIGALLSHRPGQRFLPVELGDDFDEDFAASLKAEITADERDTPDDVLVKEAVRAAKAQIVEAMKRGHRPSELAADMMAAANKVADYRDRLEEDFLKLKEHGSADDIEAYQKEANELLKEFGADPLDLPDDEVEWINDRLEKEGTGELPEEKPELSNLVIELPPKGETK